MRRLSVVLGQILLRTLLRTIVFALLVLDFYAGHKSQPLQLDIPHTAPTPHSSPAAPVLMERSAPFHHR